MNKQLEEVLKDIERVYQLKEEQRIALDNKLDEILQDLKQIELENKKTK